VATLRCHGDFVMSEDKSTQEVTQEVAQEVTAPKTTRKVTKPAKDTVASVSKSTPETKTYRISWKLGRIYGNSIPDIMKEILESHNIQDYRYSEEPIKEEDGEVYRYKHTFSIEYKANDATRINHIVDAEKEIENLMRRNQRILDAYRSNTRPVVAGGCLVPAIMIAITISALVWML
jgi:hypothetical protein